MATQNIAPGTTTLVPNAGDTVILEGGSASLVNGMDWSAVADADIVEISGAFNGQFGTPAAPFICKVTTRFVIAASGGDTYWNSTGSGSTTSARLLLMGNSHVHFITAGTLTRAEIKGGIFSISTAVTVTNLFITSGKTYFYDSASTDPTLIEQQGGWLELNRGATTLNHSSGQTIIDADANAITTLVVNGPGVQLKNSGTISTANCYGGVPDVSELGRAVTISATNIDVDLPGARQFLDHPLITHSAVTPIGRR